MPWDAIFGYANVYALLCWVVLALAPKRELIVPYLFYAGSCVLALIYAVLIVSLMTGLIADGGAPGGPSADFTTLAGIMAIFDTPGGATIGWIHYLAFDLFVGIWAARNADRRGISRIIQLPILIVILMAGPLGFVLYVILRQFIGSSPENSVVPS